jgi:hypothetical protein
LRLNGSVAKLITPAYRFGQLCPEDRYDLNDGRCRAVLIDPKHRRVRDGRRLKSRLNGVMDRYHHEFFPPLLPGNPGTTLIAPARVKTLLMFSKRRCVMHYPAQLSGGQHWRMSLRGIWIRRMASP